MGYKAVEWVWDNYHVQGSKKVVMLRLARHADDDTGECYPSIETLSTKAEISERQVHAIIKDLEANGYIAIQHGGGRTSNTYRILGYIESLTPEATFTPPLQSSMGIMGATLHPTPEVTFTPKKESSVTLNAFSGTSPLNLTSPHPCTELHLTPEATFTRINI